MKTAIVAAATAPSPNPGGLTKNRLRLSLILTLVAAHATASELPDAPVSPVMPTSHKLFLTEAGALTAANAVDGYTTLRDSNWGYAEESFALGKRPGVAKYIGVEGTIEAATLFGAWELERSRHKPLRLCAHYLVFLETSAHVEGAIHNFRTINGPLH
jgi:hypothetical protein